MKILALTVELFYERRQTDGWTYSHDGDRVRCQIGCYEYDTGYAGSTTGGEFLDWTQKLFGIYQLF
jgi:hypothetical protein